MCNHPPSTEEKTDFGCDYFDMLYTHGTIKTCTDVYIGIFAGVSVWYGGAVLPTETSGKHVAC